MRIDVEGYGIPSSLPVRSVVARTKHWRVLIGERSALLTRSSEFVLIDIGLEVERPGTS